MDIFFIVDLVLLLILVFSVLNGYMRGFVLTVSSLAGIVVAWLIGRGIAGAFAAKFDAKFISPLFSDILPKSSDTIPEVVSGVAESAVSSISGSIAYGILFVVSAIVGYALVMGIGRIIDRLFDLPVLSLINKVGGVLAGAALGCLVLLVIGMACSFAAKLMSDFLLMPEIYEYIDQTKILKYLVENNPLSRAA